MITTTQISILNLSLLIILISLSLFHFKPTHNRPQFSSPHNQTLTLTPPERSDHQDPQITRKNYIFRFLHYKRAEGHRIYLQENVKLVVWEWVERRNPAAGFPTDFGVVAIEDSARAVVVEELGKLEVVKDVSADFSYQRSLLGKKMDRVGAFVDGKKRPGKIFAVMSFSEGENYAAAVTGNKSISWKRHLLMQLNSITLRLFGWKIFSIRKHFSMFGGGGGMKVQVEVVV